MPIKSDMNPPHADRFVRKDALSRRGFLRGAGTVVALPFLEALAPARGRAPGPWGKAEPRRLVYLYVPNGAHMPDWTPKEEGSEFELPWILEPLEAHRERLSVLSGLAHDKARANGDGPGDHARAAAAFLTGVQPLKTDGKIKLGVSADQVAAQAIGQRTRFRSLELGCEQGRASGQCDSGYACAYSNNISWQGEATPVQKEINPRVAFDRLFRGGDEALSDADVSERRARKKSVLDFVRTDAKRLQRALGAEDSRKIDEYFEGLRELERRIEFIENQRVDEVPDSARPVGVPREYGEHVALMFEILALALSTDSTRVATFMLANEGSNRSYRELEISEGHHSISHHGKDPDKQRQIREINRFHVERLAEFVARLAATRESDGDLLDSTTIVYGGAIGDGNRHNHDELPVLLIGGDNPRVALGRHTRWPKNTPMGNLHLTLLDHLGAPTESLGDSTGLLVDP